MNLFCFSLILNGVIGDIVLAPLNVSVEYWQIWYSIARDIQFVGFALLAFNICPYDRVELKAATFFLVLWRVFVAIINIFEWPVFMSPVFVCALTAIYLTWLGKMAMMGEIEQEEDQPGAYYFMMPIHSIWGLLKAVFIIWWPARYESIVVVDRNVLWAVHNNRFISKHVDNTNISKRKGVKVYLGRDLYRHERVELNNYVGKLAIPGIRDCRGLKVV